MKLPEFPFKYTAPPAFAELKEKDDKVTFEEDESV
jgi:hypothetical protein